MRGYLEKASELTCFSFHLVDSRNIVLVLVHNHCAFGICAGNHSCQRRHRWLCQFTSYSSFHCSLLSVLWQNVYDFYTFQFRHKSDQQVNNRQSQVLMRGRYSAAFLCCITAGKTRIIYSNTSGSIINVCNSCFQACIVRSGWTSVWETSSN